MVSAIRYCPTTGQFNWKKRRNGVKKGACGWVDTSGYKRIQINGRKIQAHRLAFLLMGESLSDNDHVDHINGDKLDNRWKNLRRTNNRENHSNREIHRQGKLVGASYDKTRNLWQAGIKVGYIRKHLGRFKTEQEAHEAYVKAKKELVNEQ
jgi:hypothetical protein